MPVDGIPLHKTNIAIDPKTPVKVSEVEVLFVNKANISIFYLYERFNARKTLSGKSYE